jgi:hypothetical protein
MNCDILTFKNPDKNVWERVVEKGQDKCYQ